MIRKLKEVFFQKQASEEKLQHLEDRVKHLTKIIVFGKDLIIEKNPFSKSVDIFVSINQKDNCGDHLVVALKISKKYSNQDICSLINQ